MLIPHKTYEGQLLDQTFKGQAHKKRVGFAFVLWLCIYSVIHLVPLLAVSWEVVLNVAYFLQFVQKPLVNLSQFVYVLYTVTLV